MKKLISIFFSLMFINCVFCATTTETAYSDWSVLDNKPQFTKETTQGVYTVSGDNNTLYIAYNDARVSIGGCPYVEKGHKDASGEWKWETIYKGDPGGIIRNTRLVIDKEKEQLYLMYNDGAKNWSGVISKCDLKDNKKWANLNAPGADRIALNNNGTLFTLFENKTGNLSVAFYGVKTHGWISLGELIPPAPLADKSNLSLAVSPDNIVYVSFLSRVNENKYEYYIMEYNVLSGKWENVGKAPFKTFGVAHNDMAYMTVSNDNIPYIAYDDDNAVSVQKYTNNKWQYVGVSNFGKCSMAPGCMNIIFDKNNIPYIAYTGFKGIRDLHAYQYDNNKWEDISPVISGGYSYLASSPFLTLTDNGNIFLGIQDWNNSPVFTNPGATTILQFIKKQYNL